MRIKMSLSNSSIFSIWVSMNNFDRLEWLGRKFIQKKVDSFLQGLYQVILLNYVFIIITGDWSGTVQGILC